MGRCAQNSHHHVMASKKNVDWLRIGPRLMGGGNQNVISYSTSAILIKCDKFEASALS
jgi:predicted phage tail protein